MTSVDQMMELPQERNFEERPLSRKVLQGAIECRQLNFTYPDQQNPALKNINLVDQAGREDRHHRSQRLGQELPGQAGGGPLSAR